MKLYKYLPFTWSDDLSKSELKLNLSRLKCIKDESVWFSKPETVNDPYDCRPIFKHIDSIDELRDILSQLTDKELGFVLKRYPRCRTRDDILYLHQAIYDSTQSDSAVRTVMNFGFHTLAYAIVNTKLRNIGILSLAKTYRNVLMWSHYAKNHQGLCLEIDMPKNTLSLRKVNYTKAQPQLSLHEAMNEQFGKLVELFYTKSTAWRHEREWRMVSRRGNVIRQIPGAQISRIIYGLNCTKSTKQKITDFIGNQIETYQIKQKKNYTLE